MFFSDSGFPRKAGNVLPSRLKADESPSGVQMSRNILVNFSSFSSPWLKIRLSPFRAPGPRHAHWLSVFGPSTFASRRSQRICQAKKSPTLGMVKSSWKVFNYTWKLFSSSPVRYLQPIKQHFVLTSWTFLMDLAFACFTIELTRVLMCCLTYDKVAKSRVMPMFWWAAVKIFTLLSHFFCNDTKIWLK